MNEWGVVGVIVVLAGLVLTLLKPIVALTRVISGLEAGLREFGIRLKEQSDSNRASHDRLWSHEHRQDERIDDNDRRIRIIETH